MENWIIKEEIDFLRPEAKTSVKAPYILMLPGDKQAHTWEITCKKGGADTDMSGCGVHGYFLRADGQMVAVSGTAAGTKVQVTFSPACYAISGGMRGVIRVDKNNQLVTVAEGAFIVSAPVDSTQVINDGNAIPSLAELLAQIHTLEQATSTAMLVLGVNGIMVTKVEGETLVIDRVALTDDDSYAAAVEMGYTGTEEDWEDFLALVSENSSSITQAQEDAAAALQTAQASLSRSETVSVEPEDWTGDSAPYTATVNCTIATASNRLLVGIGGALTSAQQSAIAAAALLCYGQGTGTITLKAFGTAPTESIPVNVMEVK